MRSVRLIHRSTASVALTVLGLALLGAACSENVPLGTIVITPVTGSGGSGGRGGSSGLDGGLDVGSDSGTDGAGTNVLWIATFEPGDLTEWTADGSGGAQVQNTKLVPFATTELARRGRYAGKFAVTSFSNMQTANYLYREAPSPDTVYYGAWFYIPSTITVKTWLSLHHFNTSLTADGRRLSAAWDMNLNNNPRDKSLIAQLFDYGTATNHAQSTPIPVPRDTWVHFEVLMVKSSTGNGRVALWQDDVLIVDAPNVTTSPNDWIQWNTGASADELEPSTAVIYVDDATISSSRVGSAPLP